MKRHILLIPIFLFLTASSLVYGDSIDSKLTELNNHIKSENKSATKVDLLIEKSTITVNNDHIAAEHLLLEALQLANDIGYQEGLLKCNALLANIYTHYAADYFKAMQFSSTALLIAKDIGSKGVEMQMHQNISFIFSSLKDIKKAISYAENAYTIAVELDDKNHLSNLNTILGDYYEVLKDTSKMINHYGAVVKYFEDGFSTKSSRDLLSMAKYYMLEGHVLKAGKAYQEAIKLSFNQSNYNSYAKALANLAEYYLQIKDYDNSYKSITESIKVSDSLGYFQEEALQYKILSDVYEAQGEYQKANTSLNRYYSLRDSIYNEKISTQIFLFEDEFRSLIKENELQMLKDNELSHNLILKNEELKRNSLVAGLLFVILSAFALYSRLRFTRKFNNRLLAQKEELERLSIVASDTNNAVLILNKDEQVEWVNNGYLEMSGYEMNDVLGLRIFNLPHSNTWQQEIADLEDQLERMQEPVNIPGNSW